MSEAAAGQRQMTGKTGAAVERPAWFRQRRAGDSQSAQAAQTGASVDTAAIPRTSTPPLPAVEAAKQTFVRPATLGGWLALLWKWIADWWTGFYLGWGVTTSLLLHATVLLILAGIFFATEDKVGMIIGGTFDKVQDGDVLDPLVDSRLDTSFGDNTASLVFVPTSAVAEQSMMASAENLLGGNNGEGQDAGDSEAAMAMNVKVPESAITKGSFTVWTDPEDPRPRMPYDIVIQIKLPEGSRQYRLNDLSGKVIGTDGYVKVIKYASNDRRGVKDGVAQISIRIPGAAQLIRDEIQVRSRLLKEEQTIEIVF